jgi:uncharacterized protein (TIGR03435 family)
MHTDKPQFKMRFLPYLCASVCICGQSIAFAQSQETIPADVRVSPKALNQYARTNAPRGGRYELRNASMLDLVRIAYGFDSDKVLGGPSWLEMNRYDVTVKVPANATQDTANTMLQSVLEDRFRLVTHKDTKPLPTWVLTMGRKVLMKESNGDGDTGCHPHSESGTPAPGSGVGQLLTMGPDGKVTVLTLGPGQIVQYECHNMTMEAFAAATRGMIGASLGSNPVLDQTGLKGTWNFDLKYSLNFVGMAGNGPTDRISFPDAVDKQLGLKLEQHPNPTPVLIVDSVEEKPSRNPPGIAELLPPLRLPTEFEVADIKLTPPDTVFGRIQNQPGGRFVSTGMNLSSIVNNALQTQSGDQIIGMPAWAQAARFDITAKAEVEPGTNLDSETTAPLLLALLKERFGLKYHTEERALPAYSLVAVKPKMKQADPASRTHCIQANAPAGSAPGSVMMTCQNTTTAQFTEQLRGQGQGINIVPLDATGIEGGWDFTLTWNRRAGMTIATVRVGDGAAAPGDTPAASDPSGGLSIFEAIEKQLGLKLETQKRPMPVYVIDHLDQKPTDN